MEVIKIKFFDLLGWILFWLMLGVLVFSILFYGVYYGPKIYLATATIYIVSYLIFISKRLKSIKQIFKEDKYK